MENSKSEEESAESSEEALHNNSNLKIKIK